ncbi:hypothetical protein BOX15_Mlig021704g2, partial [Macrostomum lignano]
SHRRGRRRDYRGQPVSLARPGCWRTASGARSPSATGSCLRQLVSGTRQQRACGDRQALGMGEEAAVREVTRKFERTSAANLEPFVLFQPIRTTYL